MDTVAIFCTIDDFCQWFEPWWEQRLLELAPKRRRRRGGLCLSEVMSMTVTRCPNLHVPCSASYLVTGLHLPSAL